MKTQVPSKEGTASVGKANEGPALGSEKEALKTPGLGSEGGGGCGQKGASGAAVDEDPQSLEGPRDGRECRACRGQEGDQQGRVWREESLTGR